MAAARVEVGEVLDLARRPRDCPSCQVDFHVEVIGMQRRERWLWRRLWCVVCGMRWQQVIDD